MLGLYRGLSNEDYHAGPGVSKSGLDCIHRSPFHFYKLNLDPNRPPRRARAGQFEGTLAHCASLEPGEFSRRYVVVPDDAPARPTARQREAKKPSAETTAAIEWWAQFEAENAGKEVVTQQQREVALRQAESIRALPELVDVWDRGEPEVSAYWIDKQTGVLCRCRPDYKVPYPKGVVLLDVKTYSDASPLEFARQVARKRYHCQAAFYSDGYAIASGEPVLAFLFIAVETEWPYAASVVMLDEDALAQGRREYRRDLDVYAHCLNTNTWPGFGSALQVVSIPKWAIDREETAR
jgi:exodeoxyribonuclease VIII